MTLKGQTAECQLAQWTEVTEVKITAQFRDKPHKFMQKKPIEVCVCRRNKKCIYSKIYM